MFHDRLRIVLVQVLGLEDEIIKNAEFNEDALRIG